jgi:hypothetical protein
MALGPERTEWGAGGFSDAKESKPNKAVAKRANPDPILSLNRF